MSWRVRGLAASAFSLWLALADGSSAARAQGWVLNASAGRVSSQAVATPLASTGAALFVRHDGPVWGFAGGGTSFDSLGVPWIAGALGARFLHPLRGVQAGADLSARAFGFGGNQGDEGGGGMTLEAMPLLAAERAALRGELRAGALYFTSSQAGDSASRSLLASDARLSGRSGELELAAEARYWQAREGGYPYLGGSLRRSGRVSAWAEGGAWLSDRVDRPAWEVGASLRVLPGTELYLSAEQETNDPLYRLAPRRSWSLGVNRQLGRAPAPPLQPVFARAEPGGVRFTLPAALSPQPPALGGDFNQWRAIPMRREGELWVARVALAPGAYHYAFRGADGAWFVPAGAPGRGDDGFGGVSALLLVP